MRLALDEAMKAKDLGEVPIGAVIVDKDGNLISAGYNLRETNSDATAHAEMIAIQIACKKLSRWRLNNLTLYVTLEPCPMCAGALVACRISRLVYGIYDSRAGACESIFNITNNPALNHRIDVRAGVLEYECKSLLQQFFQARR